MQGHKESQIIWAAFRAGDEKAFSRLFYLYSDDLFYYGCSITNDRELVKDSIQELLCSLWERKSQCPEVNKVKYFLLSGLRRILLRKIQQQQRLVLTSIGEEEPQNRNYPYVAVSMEEDLIREERHTESQIQLMRAIQGLPPRQQEAIHLRYYQGLSYAEMAEVMAVQKGSVGQFIAQAIRALRKKMMRTDLTFFLPFFCLLLL